MKKVLIILLAVFITAALFACGTVDEPDDGRITVVTTVFPIYDWVTELTQGNADYDVILLCDNGTDMHSFQPTAEDIIAIKECDLFVCVGGESEEWCEGICDESVTLRLGDGIACDGHNHDAHNEHDSHEHTFDEHIWLSLRNAAHCCTLIAERLNALKPDGAINDSLTSYVARLNELDDLYSEAADGGVFDTLVFCDRFPFYYLAKDYGLNYIAAFDGCSSECEASFETVITLADKIDDLGIKHVLIIEGSGQSIAATVINSCADKEIQILAIDSMQSVKGADIENGKDFIGTMESNLEILKSALGYGG